MCLKVRAVGSHTDRNEISILHATILNEGIKRLGAVDVGGVPWVGVVAPDQSIKIDAAFGGVIELRHAASPFVALGGGLGRGCGGYLKSGLS